MARKRESREEKLVMTTITALVCLVVPLFVYNQGVDTKAPKAPAPASSEVPASYEDFKEKDYVDAYCTGEKEYVLSDRTRVDCLTDEYAIEFDYAKKWAEGVGQSLYYSSMTGKKPAVALILKTPEDEKYVRRAEAANPEIKIFIVRAGEELKEWAQEEP